jgi:hypothetical protein
MGIHHTFPWREIHQLHAHGHNDPSHTQARPYRPRASNLPILHVAEPTPEHVCDDANHDIRRHIVRIIPRPERKVSNMQRVQQHAQRSPYPQQRPLPRFILVQPEDAYGRIVHPIQDIRARRKVIQLLCQIEVPGMENHTKHPTRQIDVAPPQIVLAQRVRRGDLVAELRHAPVVCEVVEQGEDDAEGLLHAHEAVKRPFAVVLVYGLRVRRVVREAGVGHDVLACIVAFGGTVPEKKTAVQGCLHEDVSQTILISRAGVMREE